jgi:hypothetical protein
MMMIHEGTHRFHKWALKIYIYLIMNTKKRDRPVARSSTLSRQEKDALDAEVRLVACKQY